MQVSSMHFKETAHVKLHDARLRHNYGARFDFRGTLVDWDYQGRAAPRVLTTRLGPSAHPRACLRRLLRWWSARRRA